MKKTDTPDLDARASKALDMTHSCGERGPRTMNARSLIAGWLDGTRRPNGIFTAILWLEKVAKEERGQ